MCGGARRDTPLRYPSGWEQKTRMLWGGWEERMWGAWGWVLWILSSAHDVVIALKDSLRLWLSAQDQARRIDQHSSRHWLIKWIWWITMKNKDMKVEGDVLGSPKRVKIGSKYDQYIHAWIVKEQSLKKIKDLVCYEEMGGERTM